MTPTLQEIAWYRAFGLLIDAIDKEDFWHLLVRRLEELVAFDNWVALAFVDKRPCLLAESPALDGGPDPLFRDYLSGIYLIDPFYRVNCEAPQTGLFRLRDVAPDCFEQTDYYQRYFRLNIVADEIQYNCRIDEQRMLCLSFGARHLFSETDIAQLSLMQPWVLALMRQRMHFEEPATTAAGHQETLETLRGLLTSREFDVCQLMLGGHSSKEIARRLSISLDTVKTHKRHIYGKLNINTQSELFAYFLQGQQ